MVLKRHAKSERVLTEEEQCDMAKASQSTSLSTIELDEDEGKFFATLDHMRFKKITKVVISVLEANGFVPNLENIIACMDTFKFGVFTSVPNGDEEGVVRVRNFNDCFQFQLPAKNQVGEVLSKFYSEIEAYETELARLQENKTKSKKDRFESSKKAMMLEVERTKHENDLLNEKISDFSEKLNRLQRSHASATNALDTHNVLPDSMRVGVVKAVSVPEREIQLKLGRKTVHVSMALLTVIPEIGDPCIVKMMEGIVSHVFLYESKGQKLDVVLGTVLFVSAGVFKYRDNSRRTYTIRAKNEEEKKIIKELVRGNRIILYVYREHVLRFTICRDSNEEKFTRIMQEQVSAYQLKNLGDAEMEIVDEEEVA